MRKCKHMLLHVLFVILLFMVGCAIKEQNVEESQNIKEKVEESSTIEEGKKEKEITTLRWGIIGEYNFVGDDIEFIDKKRASKVIATLKEKD